MDSYTSNMDNPFNTEVEAGRAELDAVCLECLNTCQVSQSRASLFCDI